MSLIDKKNAISEKPSSKVKLISVIVAAVVSFSAVGFYAWQMNGENDDTSSSATILKMPVGEAQSLPSSTPDDMNVASKKQSGDVGLSKFQQETVILRDAGVDIDKASLDISKKFFGGRLVEYIEFNNESGLYAVIPSGSEDVYFVNMDKGVVIKGDAYLVSNSSATLINDSVKAAHKKNFKASVDVLSLTGDIKKDVANPVSAEPKKAAASSGGVEKSTAQLDNQDVKVSLEAAKSAQSTEQPPSENGAYDEAQSTNSSDSKVILDKLANGETVRPLREPTEDEVKEIKIKAEEESAKILFGQKLKDDYLIVYNPPEGVKTVATINVFADPECPSCKKLHKDVNSLLGLGVKVRYITMPRKGLDSSIAKQMAVAFCSPNKQDIFNSLFSGKRYDIDVDGFDSCFSLVSKNANLGYSLGIKHTPTIYSSDTGKVFEGYPSGDGAYIDLLDKLDMTSLLGKK